MADGEIRTELAARASAAAESLIACLAKESQTLALAESCTAGLAADLLAHIPGASKVLWGSFVCYTPEAKVAMLGLDPGRLKMHGLVSAETARDMALGALVKSGAGMAAGVTGLAGPCGDGSGVPVGTVWIAAVRRPGEAAPAREFHFQGSRNDVRLQAAIAVLEVLEAFAIELLSKPRLGFERSLRRNRTKVRRNSL
jgi:PncC family amidohydrolase